MSDPNNRTIFENFRHISGLALSTDHIKMAGLPVEQYQALAQQYTPGWTIQGDWATFQPHTSGFKPNE